MNILKAKLPSLSFLAVTATPLLIPLRIFRIINPKINSPIIATQASITSIYFPLFSVVSLPAFIAQSLLINASAGV
jgi:hypothetical protein